MHTLWHAADSTHMSVTTASCLHTVLAAYLTLMMPTPVGMMQNPATHALSYYIRARVSKTDNFNEVQLKQLPDVQTQIDKVQLCCQWVSHAMFALLKQLHHQTTICAREFGNRLTLWGVTMANHSSDATWGDARRKGVLPVRANSKRN